MIKNKDVFKRTGFVFGIAVLGITLLVVRSCYIQRAQSQGGSHIRPEDFPECLIPPTNTLEVRYHTPSNTKIIKGAVSIKFKIDELYPGKRTRKFIEDTLKRHGWFKLKHILFNPELPVNQEWQIRTITEPSSKYHELPECWMNKKDEIIHVVLIYEFLENGEPDLNTLYVSEILFGTDTWQHPFAVKYKKLHPEEFESSLNEK
jgi:hypothetical protein